MLKHSIASSFVKPLWVNTRVEIEDLKGFEKDEEFLQAINEDDEFILKYYKEQLQVLNQLEVVNNQNYLLETHNIKIQAITDKHSLFQSLCMNKFVNFI